MGLPRLSPGSAEMEKLDRLAWAAGISFRAYGLRIGIRTNSADVLGLVKSRLPITWKPSKSPIVDSLYSVVKPRAKGKRTGKQFNLLYKGSETFARSMDLNEVLSELEIDLHSYVATATLQRMFLHAGVVGWNGRAIVIPGKNFSGKTSLVTAFLRAGATYYSDEFAVLDSRGRVHPYPWALHIREGISRPKEFSVEMLGARAGTKPLPVGVVILSEYRRGAKWRPRRVTPGQAALAMLDRVMSKRHQPDAMLPALGQMVSGATVLKGTRGEAKEVVESVLQKFVD
jgi:hypothetical protein